MCVCVVVCVCWHVFLCVCVYVYHVVLVVCFFLGDDIEPDCYGQAVTLSSAAKVKNEEKDGWRERERREIKCILTYMYVLSQHLFSHSICKATHWTEAFVATERQYDA